MMPILTATHDELSWFVQQARAPRLRTMRQFAEEELIIPDGPFEGRRFKIERQPFTGLWLDAVDSGRFNRIITTGPTQTGKTLLAFVLPIAYHLFEVGETVICGVPHMDMAGDKWREDILPVIERTRYRDQLPRAGAGSRGGRVDALRMRNGSTLKFMSGGGSDKSRAGFTSRVLVVTETDGMDVIGGTSREADKITQLEGRTRAYGSRKRIYLECTVSTEEGRTWREYLAGTQSKIMLPCPHCDAYVTPEREHLHGWRDCQTELEARSNTQFYCPACGEAWSETDRREANLAAKLIHRGQDIAPDGSIKGDVPATDTLGFRWSAVQNMFTDPGVIGGDEWRAAKAVDEDNSERSMRQYVWALPYQSLSVDLTPLKAETVRNRQARWPKGLLPAGTEFLTIGVDIGKRIGHWVLTAFCGGRRRHVPYYGVIEFDTDQLGVLRGTLTGLRDFRDMIVQAPYWKAESGPTPVPVQIWIDVGWSGKHGGAESRAAIEQFVKESNAGLTPGQHRWRCTLGHGATQHRNKLYHQPKKTGARVRMLSEDGQYHIARLRNGRQVVELNADHWKSAVHEGLWLPADAEGAISIYHDDPREHTEFSKHITAEKPVQTFVPDKGNVTVWKQIRDANHFLDAFALSLAAGHFTGFRLVADAQADPDRPAAGETSWFAEQKIRGRR